MKLTISKEDKMSNFILNADNIELPIKFKLICINILGNENQKRLVSKIAFRYAYDEMQPLTSKRVLTKIDEMFNEINSKYNDQFTL